MEKENIYKKRKLGKASLSNFAGIRGVTQENNVRACMHGCMCMCPCAHMHSQEVQRGKGII